MAGAADAVVDDDGLEAVGQREAAVVRAGRRQGRLPAALAGGGGEEQGECRDVRHDKGRAKHGAILSCSRVHAARRWPCCRSIPGCGSGPTSPTTSSACAHSSARHPDERTRRAGRERGPIARREPGCTPGARRVDDGEGPGARWTRPRAPARREERDRLRPRLRPLRTERRHAGAGLRRGAAIPPRRARVGLLPRRDPGRLPLARSGPAAGRRRHRRLLRAHARVPQRARSTDSPAPWPGTTS